VGAAVTVNNVLMSDAGLGGGSEDSSDSTSDVTEHGGGHSSNDKGNNTNKYNLGIDYNDDFDQMKNRALEWMDASGFKRATGLQEVAESLRNIQRLTSGESIFNEQNLRPSGGSYSLLSDSTGDKRYSLGSPVELGTFEHTKPWADLYIWATSENFVITGANEKSGHNKNSAHYKGQAIDVRARGKTNREIDALIEKARSMNLKVRDERTRPEGQKVWSGPHVHIETRSTAPNRIQQSEGSTVQPSGVRLKLP
jgi:hypothetical protein